MGVSVRWWSRFVLILTLAALWPRLGAAQVCNGDCDGDGQVLVNELVLGVNLALGASGSCASLDIDGDGVEVNELVIAVNNALEGCPETLTILEPEDGMLVLAGTVAARISLPPALPGSLQIELDGVAVTEQFTETDGEFRATLLGVAAGEHTLSATANVDGEDLSAEVTFEAVALLNPGECEVLNNEECLLPYPSSRFLVADDRTATGFRVNIPASGLPDPNGPPILPDPVNKLDGFNPMAQILMHFPQGVDVERSDASRLLAPGCCEQPAGPPWIDTRTYDARSLDAESPSVLLDATTGEHIIHFLENDAHAAGNLQRQSLIMRPGISLLPDRRYIVAMRNLRSGDGSPIVAEAAFAALRDGRKTNIPAIESRRAAMDDMFGVLEDNGIARDDLVLAFEFHTQSEQQLTAAMLSMRDQAFAWLADVEADPEEITFSVANVQENDCAVPDTVVWRLVTGKYQVPLFLTKDPNAAGVGVLNLGEDGVPVQNGFTESDFSISIPCSILQTDGPVPHPIILGHGLFGSGLDMAALVPGLAASVTSWTYVAGATDWRGMSSKDLQWLINEVIGVGENKLNNFSGLPDRLKQGMLNTLVLAKMMKRGLFNRDTEAFETPSGAPVFRGPDTEMFYYGISLGGIMGTWFSAVTPDVERFGVDVPAINFDCLLQRSTQFGQFETLLQSFGLTDPMQTILGMGILQELWVAGEPAGYARHITSDPLPGSGPAKRILMTPAWLDKQVSNQCTEIAARTLQLPNLVPASLQRELQGIPDREGPLDSAYVMFNTGSFDLFNPAHQEFIPPLANRIPSGVCDPHGARPRIPDGIRMLTNFLKPGGQVENFCNGICDAGEPQEIAGGAAMPCDPLD